MKKREFSLYVSLGLLGLLVWLVIGEVSDSPEAWDSALYFTVGLPFLFLVSGVAGYLEPERPWRWGVSIVIPQFIALFFQSKAGPLAIIGLLFFAFIGLFWIYSANLGSMIRKRHSKRT